MKTYIIILSLFWIISPYGFIFAFLLLVNQKMVSLSSLKYFDVLISLSFALLAFTQKSHAIDDTDVIRYYESCRVFLNASWDVIPLLLSEEILTYTFTLVNAVIVIIFRDVQLISLFWVWIIYYFYFLSFEKIFANEDIPLTRTNLFLYYLFSLFGAILFVKVTDTIKSAAAISVFFYLLISFIYGAKKWKLLLGVWITVGIHSMVLMLLPLFLYKRVTLRFLIFTLFGVILLSPVINLMNILSLFPINDVFMLLLQEKVAVYATDQEGVTKRYIVISIITLLYALFLNKQKQFSKEDKYVNIIFIYLLIMWLCFNNATAFVRMVNFAHFIYTFELIFLLKYMRKKSPQFVLFIFFFLITNFQMTLGRTITGAYRSSYMDNSIVKILTSSVFDYLSYKTFF